MAWIHAVLGVVLLFFGRSLYWAFVAVAGFLVAWEFAASAFSDLPDMMRLLIAIGVGVIGAVIALIAQRVAFALGGAYAGAYLALAFGQNASPETAPMLWILVGGIIGGVAAAMLMDWAIIILSSLVGAWAIVATLPVAPPLAMLAFLVLFAVGVAAQANGLRRTTNLQETV
ncbi:DUF4203 domain-containing protein [Bremerella sp. JC817]|uniref:TM7S3/TM198-like domain-containing protein n=1 Tax=Bremerella sp. JC817 TaxID=3231756 RepID=UPI0034588317